MWTHGVFMCWLCLLWQYFVVGLLVALVVLPAPIIVAHLTRQFVLPELRALSRACLDFPMQRC